MTQTLVPTEAEAAEAEGLVAIDSNRLIVAKFQDLERLEALVAPHVKAIKDLKDEIRSDIAARNGAQAFTYGGRVVARLSKVRSTNVDKKGLALRYPGIYRRFTSITESMRLTIDW